jgi:hypothetical protein
MKDTVKTMLESSFGFSTTEYSRNREILEGMDFVSEEVRQMTGYTPEKVNVLNDNNHYYIEYANNLERLMEDARYDFKEALEMVTAEYKICACDVNIIVDESCVDRIDMEALVKVVGADHVFRK